MGWAKYDEDNNEIMYERFRSRTDEPTYFGYNSRTATNEQIKKEAQKKAANNAAKYMR